MVKVIATMNDVGLIDYRFSRRFENVSMRQIIPSCLVNTVALTSCANPKIDLLGLATMNDGGLIDYRFLRRLVNVSMSQIISCLVNMPDRFSD